MGALATNNAVATLSTSINAQATQITLAGGNGEMFPAAVEGKTWFYGTLYDKNNNIEVVKVVSRQGDSLAVLRGQDGTMARKFDAGDGFDLRPTAALFNDKVSHDELTDKASDIKNSYVSADAAVQKTLQDQIDVITDTYAKITYVDEQDTAVKDNTADKYYTQETANGKFLPFTGGTITGDLTVNGKLTAKDSASFTTGVFSGALQANSVRTTSDARLKRSVVTLGDSGCLEEILGLHPVTFQWIAGDGERKRGFIAQDVKDVIPEAVGTNGGTYSIEYSAITATLAGAVRELASKVEELESEIKLLKEKINGV